MPFLRRLMAIEAAAFAAAALVHSGVLIGGFESGAAATAESVIGLVLISGAVLAWSRPSLTRPTALAAQGFALAGSLVGLYVVAIGIGPNTVPDVIFHIAIVLTLAVGLVRAAGAAPEPRWS